MYKKVLLLLVSFDVLTRVLAMIAYFVIGGINLPLPVLGISGLLAVVGVLLIIKFLTKGVSLKEISLYLTLDFLGILFNIIYSRVISLVESTKLIDTLIIGNVLLLPLCPILIYVSIKKNKYISIPAKVIQSAPDVSEQAVGGKLDEEVVLSIVNDGVPTEQVVEKEAEEVKIEAAQENVQDDIVEENIKSDEKSEVKNKPQTAKKGNHKKGKKSKKR